MQIIIGKSYRLINRDQKSAVWCHVLEMFQRSGQFIVVGTLSPQDRIARSAPLPELACAFPVFVRDGASVVKLMGQLKSAPLYLEVEAPVSLEIPGQDPLQVGPGHYLPVLNVPRPKPATVTRDELVRRAAELIQVWEEWQRLGQVVPMWFRDILAKERQLQRAA